MLFGGKLYLGRFVRRYNGEKAQGEGEGGGGVVGVYLGSISCTVTKGWRAAGLMGLLQVAQL